MDFKKQKIPSCKATGGSSTKKRRISESEIIPTTFCSWSVTMSRWTSALTITSMTIINVSVSEQLRTPSNHWNMKSYSLIYMIKVLPPHHYRWIKSLLLLEIGIMRKGEKWSCPWKLLSSFSVKALSSISILFISLSLRILWAKEIVGNGVQEIPL